MKGKGHHTPLHGYTSQLLLPPNLETVGPVPFTAQDFAKLDAWLAEEGWPDGRMDVAMLEGYLVALLSWPIELGAGAWLPPIWGHTRLESGCQNRKLRNLQPIYRAHHRIVSRTRTSAELFSAGSYVCFGMQHALPFGTLFCWRSVGNWIPNGAARELHGIGRSILGRSFRGRGHCTLCPASLDSSECAAHGGNPLK